MTSGTKRSGGLFICVLIYLWVCQTFCGFSYFIYLNYTIFRVYVEMASLTKVSPSTQIPGSTQGEDNIFTNFIPFTTLTINKNYLVYY